MHNIASALRSSPRRLSAGLAGMALVLTLALSFAPAASAVRVVWTGGGHYCAYWNDGRLILCR
jgi:hypothetical protein